MSFHIDAEFVLLLTKTLGHQVISNSNNAFGNKVHFANVVFFVKDESFFFGSIKLSWFKAETNIVQEF